MAQTADSRRQAQRKRRRRRQRAQRRFLGALAVLLLVAAVAVVLDRRAGKNDYTLLEEDWVTEAYLPVNRYSRPGTPLKQVKGIVVHYVGNPGTTAQQNRDYFAGLAESGETSASSHFVIGLEGEVLQCIPLNEIAYCSNNRNDDTISIECCHPGEDGAFTQETYDSLIRLLRRLCQLYRLEADDIIRHYDVTGKECPVYYVEHEDAWEQLKQDVFSYTGSY